MSKGGRIIGTTEGGGGVTVDVDVNEDGPIEAASQEYRRLET